MKKIFVCFGIAMVLIAGAAYADVVIIANKNVQETSLSPDVLQEIFLGKRVQWKDNSKISFVLIKNEELHEVFLKTYIKKSSSQFKSYWKNMVFTGQGSTPTSFETPKEIIDYVSNTPGAVGYIESGDAKGTNIKTISIE